MDITRLVGEVVSRILAVDMGLGTDIGGQDSPHKYPAGTLAIAHTFFVVYLLLSHGHHHCGLMMNLSLITFTLQDCVVVKQLLSLYPSPFYLSL